MTEHQIIQMLHKVIAENTNFTTWTVSTPHLVALVDHAVKQEREACAKICDKEVEEWKYDADVVDVAIAIRARGEL